MQRYVCAVLDTETTGFNHHRDDRLVECAIVKIRDLKVQKNEYFSTLINPQRNIPPAASRVNKIFDHMVKDAPIFKDIVNDLFNFISDVDYLFIHNAKFDLGFLQAETARLGQSLKLPKVICSVELSKSLYPHLQSHNLNAIAKRFNLSIKEGENRHRALGDVILTGEAILKFYEENPLIFLGTLDSLQIK